VAALQVRALFVTILRIWRCLVIGARRKLERLRAAARTAVRLRPRHPLAPGTDLPDVLPLCSPDCLRLPPLVLCRSLWASILPCAWRRPSWKRHRDLTTLPQPPARSSVLAWPSQGEPWGAHGDDSTMARVSEGASPALVLMVLSGS
jgi:hypothetical protein